MRPHRHTVTLPLAFAGATAFLAGCVSLDPTADYEEAMSLVAEHSGWRPEWNAPWSDTVPDWDQTSPLSVDQAVTIALQNNRGLRATLEGIASARADLVQSGLLPNPVLSAAFRSPVGGDSGATSISIGFVQQLTDLWLRPARTDAAESALRDQILTVSDVALRLVADVRQGHAQLVGTQRGIGLTHSHMDLLERAIEVTGQRIAAGESSQLDENRLRQSLYGRQAELAQQELDLDVQKRELLEVLGLADAPAEWEAEDVVPPLEAWSDEFTESDLVALARQQRLDVAAARKTHETRINELRVANLGSLPKVAAGLDSERDEEKFDSFGPVIDLELPIFDNNRARIAKALSDLRRAKIEADLILQRAVTQTRSAWVGVRTSLELVDFYRDRVIALARENLELAQQAQLAGQVDMTVVLETQRELILAEVQLNQLEARAALSLIELEYAVGGRLGRLETMASREPEGKTAIASPTHTLFEGGPS